MTGSTRFQPEFAFVIECAACDTRDPCAPQLTPPIHRRAERLLLSTKIPLRAADALHIATALDAGAATVVSFDERLRAAAKSQGLFIGPSLI